MSYTTQFDMPGFCHIYSPEAWHEDAFIVAGNDALLKIKEAIDNAIESGQGSCNLFVNDGEGFDLIILAINDPVMKNKIQIPYTDSIASSQNGLHPAEVVDYGALSKEKQKSKLRNDL